MGTIKNSSGMLKWHILSIIGHLLNIVLLSLFCYFLYGVISEPIIRSTTDAYLKRDIQSWEFSNFIKLLTLIYLLDVITIGLFFNKKKYTFKLIVKIILSVLSVWFFASLYRTLNLYILLSDQMLYVFYIPLLIGSIVLPFSELLILTVIQKIKNKSSKEVFKNLQLL